MIQIFVLKVINNERKFLNQHKIIDRITEKSYETWWLPKCAKNQNCGFVGTYGDHASH